jgi:ATP-dependent RNA helicase DBP3
MAATKHTLVESEETRPIKKAKVVESDDLKAQLKKEKKEKKKEKKDKKDKKSSDSDEDKSAKKAEKKARKEEKRRLKEAKKQQETENEVSDDAPAAATAAAPADEKFKKAKKEKPVKNSTKPSEASASYAQTDVLTNLPQSDIDSFMSTNQITITDPKTADVTLRPIVEFAHLPPTDLLTQKKSPFANYKAPTPIQSASWPFTLSGRDVVGVAETGSGKTMAFALPCVQAVAAISKRGTKAVIVSPTRELAMQTHEQLAALAALAGLKCVCLYGGSSKDEQRALINRGADIVVATPGRLKDFMSDDTVNLSGSKFVVLDEADRMLDKGFEEDIKTILGGCPPREQRQTLMFTATWPFSVQALASSFMVEPVKIAIGAGGKETEGGGVELQANPRITQRVEVVDPRDKEFRLLQLLKQHQQGGNKNDRILVFCLYKKEATRVENFLSRKGVCVGGIHGDLRQEQRTKSLEAFKTGHTPVLVATDVAARGLDIPEVKLVINVTVSFYGILGE